MIVIIQQTMEKYRILEYNSPSSDKPFYKVEFNHPIKIVVHRSIDRRWTQIGLALTLEEGKEIIERHKNQPANKVVYSE